MIEDYEQVLIEWAHGYNGYERLAASADSLWDLLRPLENEFERTGRVPDWAGVDLLRGWAFYVVRAHRHGGYGPLLEEHPEFANIIEAIDQHPAARAVDRAPRQRSQ